MYYRSSETGYWFVKVAAVAMLLVLLVVAYDLVRPDDALIPSEYKNVDVGLSWFDLIVSCVVVAVMLLFSFVFLFQFAVVTCQDDGVVVEKGAASTFVPWSNVKYFDKIPLTTPPIYRFEFRSGVEPAYFIMSMTSFASVGIWSWEFSGLSRAVRTKLKPKRRVFIRPDA